jgi:hypothetical protein
MAHTYTQQDGHRQSFEHLGDFLGEVVRRCSRDDMRLPVIIMADLRGLHITEMVCIQPNELDHEAAPLGAALGLHLVRG